MRFKSRIRSVAASALCALVASSPAGVSWAQAPGNSIFPVDTPSGVRDRMFMRIDYIRANVKTTADPVRDVSGPVLAVGEVTNLLGNSTLIPIGRRNVYRTQIGPNLDEGIALDVANGYTCQAPGLGSPCGTRARAQAMIGTPALSIGYFLDDDHSWAVEGFVLAKPIDVTIKGDGPNSVNGKDIIELKMLPPVVKLGHYFGKRGDGIRPYAGVLGSYAVFYDVKSTQVLNKYVGGVSANDTSVSVKNTLGFGWMLGARADVTDDWHFNFGVGKLRFKTEATIVTHNTVIQSGADVLRDYGPNTYRVILAAEGTVPTTQVMCDLALVKRGNTSCNLGEFVRKSSTVLDNTLFVISAGRSF